MPYCHVAKCTYFIPLGEKDLKKILDTALKTDNLLKAKEIKIKESKALIELAGGDARKLLSLLELVVQNQKAKKKK